MVGIRTRRSIHKDGWRDIMRISRCFISPMVRPDMMLPSSLLELCPPITLTLHVNVRSGKSASSL